MPTKSIKKEKILIIVESPTKARTISQFLGSAYDVESSFGHIRDLPKSKLGVDVEHNFTPHYIIPVKAKKHVTLLKKKAAKSSRVILATDEDREGEAIAWHLREALDLDKEKTARIVFHEITKRAIDEALKHPRALYMQLIDAQQARRVLDRLVGYTLSPFLWKKVARGLSAGRVQSVAVRLICDREHEIEQFKKEEYWTIGAQCASKEHLESVFTTELAAIDETNLGKFDITTEARAKEITDDLATSAAHIQSIEKKEEQKHPLPPFTTSTLQQASGQRLHFSAKQTMMYAQHLYEKGYITYMRTDSVNLSRDSIEAAKVYIEHSLGPKYTSATGRIFKTKSKLAQEAHEAIRPTNVELAPEDIKGKLEDEREWRLYDLIWRRFLATQLPSARIAQTKIEVLAISQMHHYILRATGARMLFDGFLKIYPMKVSENILPELSESEPLVIESVNPLQHFTEPPPRYNEASLIKALEKFGIGRPSTYAPTISTIQERGYVERDDHKRLQPTETGSIVNNLLTKHFPKIVDIEFTANMEESLDEIAEGKKDWVPVIKAFYDPFSKQVESKYESVVSQKIEEQTNEICPNCGKPMVIKRGRFGKFIACSGFPECKTTKRLPEPALKDMKCPTCGEGDVVRRRSKRGRYFFGCSCWPDCDFISWTLPKQETNEAHEIIL